MLIARREDIEYPVAGGGIYSTSSNYTVVLQNLLQHHLSLSGKRPRPKVTLLSDKSVSSLFEPSLPEAAKKGMATTLSMVMGGEVAVGDADWTTGMSIYLGPRRDGTRHPGTVGWGGAAGTQYWIDEAAGIAVSNKSNFADNRSCALPRCFLALVPASSKLPLRKLCMQR